MISFPAQPATGSLSEEIISAGKKLTQRISSPGLSDELKASRMGDPDETLVWESLRGDPAAFESLVRNHQRMIHSLAYRMTGSLTDAEDLAQETFVRAYGQLSEYRSQAKFSTWLYRIAINTCLNWRQREHRRRTVHTLWASAAETDRPEASSDHGDAGGPGELSERIQAALLRLPTRQRAAVVLTVYDGLNHAEAAKALGCSETTVSWRVFTARRKLKAWLQAGVTHE
jgi:RNA polymerase sigma-70 factor (ECF subfamily)